MAAMIPRPALPAERIPERNDGVTLSDGLPARFERTSVHDAVMARYTVNDDAVAHARKLIATRRYVLTSDWGEAQPRADDENRYLERHGWDEYASWHLGLTEGANDGTKARYAFVFGDFRRIHRSAIIACHFRAAEWRHKEVELAAHELLQLIDRRSGLIR
jgi:hypothetical protein